MTDLIIGLSKAVIDKLNSPAYSKWKFVKGEEVGEKSLSQSTYRLKYQDEEDGRDHELKVVKRCSQGKIRIIPSHKTGSRRSTHRRKERGECDLEIYDWKTGERLD